MKTEYYRKRSTQIYEWIFYITYTLKISKQRKFQMRVVVGYWNNCWPEIFNFYKTFCFRSSFLNIRTYLHKSSFIHKFEESYLGRWKGWDHFIWPRKYLVHVKLWEFPSICDYLIQIWLFFQQCSVPCSLISTV